MHTRKPPILAASADHSRTVMTREALTRFPYNTTGNRANEKSLLGFKSLTLRQAPETVGFRGSLYHSRRKDRSVIISKSVPFTHWPTIAYYALILEYAACFRRVRTMVRIVFSPRSPHDRCSPPCYPKVRIALKWLGVYPLAFPDLHSYTP